MSGSRVVCDVAVMQADWWGTSAWKDTLNQSWLRTEPATILQQQWPVETHEEVGNGKCDACLPILAGHKGLALVRGFEGMPLSAYSSPKHFCVTK